MLKSSESTSSAETHGIQHPAPAMLTKHHLPAGLQITPATPPTSSTQPGSPSRKTSLFDRRNNSHKTAPNTPGSSPPMSAQATRLPKQHSGPLHDLKRFLNHHIGHHGDRPSSSRTASNSFGGSQTPAPHPAVLAVAHDGLATPMSGMGGHASGVQTPGSQMRGQYFSSMAMSGSTTSVGGGSPNTPGGPDTPAAGWGSAAPSRHPTNQGGSAGVAAGGTYQVKEHDRTAQKTREAHGHHTNHLVGFLKHHNRDHDKSSSTISSFFHRATADEKAQARRAREEEKEKEREAKVQRERERVAAKEARETAREAARAEGKSVQSSPAPTPTVSRSTPTAVHSTVSSVVASGAQTPVSPHGSSTVIGPGHFPEPGSFEATQAHLSKKYGKWGRVLGSGAGGTVRLIKSSGKAGNTVYAVKEFRPRRNNEDAKDYQRKVMAEFCVGVTLKHVNVIETVDIINDHGHFFEVSTRCRFSFYHELTRNAP
ncbi:hypothetical protein QFC22_002044 [Naganishia vaughanmartiniae]|uniref:Uncharacterized protein n=1 Tax=Naganishia vaughanmartiniae TaxID=1424756 RepID=A0ACC2XG75_9TREE|nr:hypothetical protein QFC22_002044 [Naganishia vaughanmartiniae]